eukprot:CCRYP_003925-RC/>CCRYP_003925-RC protein AED:0.03 eAED:0.03 QI:96/1/1/1/0.66/0.5/4/138/634
MDDLLTPANLNDIRESDLMEVPFAEASKARFPPTCSVWIIADDKDRANSGIAVHTIDASVVISEGMVVSVFIGDVFSTTRQIYYKIEGSGPCFNALNSAIVEEARLAYARRTPVYFFDDVFGKNKTNSGAAQRGEVLSCKVMLSCRSSLQDHVNYTILILGEDNNHIVRHDVRPQQLQFLFDKGFKACSSSEPKVIEFASLSIPSPPPGFLNASLGRIEKDVSLPQQQKIKIPHWLVSSDCDLVRSTISGAVPVIEQMTGCIVRIVETTTDFSLVVRAPNNVSSLIRGAIEIVENAMIQMVIVSEQSRGRFLYDMASYYGEMKPDGAVQQRSPFNSTERVWMNVIDIPVQTVGEELRDNFGTKLLRCEPYILIIGKQAKNVSIATAAIKNAIKRHTQKSAQVVPTSLINNERLRCSPHTNSTFKSRKLTLPLWLLSDEAFRQRIHATLFEGDQCTQMRIREKAGCDIVSMQRILLVRTMPKCDGVYSNINKATDIIENDLLDLLGAEESKPRLLYDLTESYSEVSYNGLIMMRNFMQSFERVWACIVEMPIVHVDENGKTKYSACPFLCKDTDDEMHKLRCTLKVCGDNFGVHLHRCKPYVIIIGKQKGNVGKAFEYVIKSLKKYQTIQRDKRC